MIDMPHTLGTSDLLALGLVAAARTSSGLTGLATAGATVDFDSTFSLTMAQVFDSEKNVILDGEIVSANNFVYPTAVMLEPSLSFLMLGALVGAVALRRNWRRLSDV